MQKSEESEFQISIEMVTSAIERIRKAIVNLRTISIGTEYSIDQWARLMNAVSRNPQRRHYLRKVARRQGNDWIHIK